MKAVRKLPTLFIFYFVQTALAIVFSLFSMVLFMGCLKGGSGGYTVGGGNGIGGGVASTSSAYSPAASQVPILNTQTNQVFPSNELEQASTLNLDWYNTLTVSDTGMSYTCYFDQVVDGSVAAVAACSTLTGTVSFSAVTGVLLWTPDKTVRGVFEIKVSGTNVYGTGTSIALVTVRDQYVQTNLLGDFDALFHNLISPPTAASVCSTTGLYDLSINGYNIASGSCSLGTWAGTGAYSSPYRMTFAGTGSASLGTAMLNAQPQVMFHTWVAPSSASSTDKIILSNQNHLVNTGGGLVVKQSPHQGNRMEFQVGKKFYTYKELILSDKPVGYWRLGEGAGVTANDLSAYANNGTYTNGPTLSAVGALTGDADTAVTFDHLSSEYISVADNNIFSPSAFSIESWIKFDGITYVTGNPADWAAIISKGSFGAGEYTILYHRTSNGTPRFNLYINGTNPIAYNYTLDTNWHYIVASYDGATANLYIDSTLVASAATATGVPNSANPVRWGTDNGAQYFWGGSLDDLAIYNYTLTPTQIANHYKAGLDQFDRPEYPANAVLADNPVGYWRLGEPSGSIANDSSGRGNNGAYTGSVSLGAADNINGDTDTAASFDGSNQYVSIANSSTLNFGTADFTVSAWVKPNIGTNIHILGKDNYAGGAMNYTGYYLQYSPSNDQKFRFATRNFVAGAGPVTVLDSTGAYANGSWYHVTGVRNNGTLKIYINASADGTAVEGSTTNVDTAVGFKIGKFDELATNYFNGSIDEVAVFNYALSPTQITDHYNAGAGVKFQKCLSRSTFSDNAWKLLSGIWDGTNLSFYVNGCKECDTQPTAPTFTQATALTLGASAANTKNWSGSVSDVKLYSTGTSANVKTNFDATADRYRENPVGNILTNGLVLHLDASNGKDGLSRQTACAATADLNWFDLSPSNLMGVLTSFSNPCIVTSGWNGAGTTADPYQITFDGVDDYVQIADNSAFNITNITIEAWLKVASADSGGGVVCKGDGGNGEVWCLDIVGAGPYDYRFFIRNPLITAYTLTSSVGPNNTWQHLVATYDGNILKTYVNATETGTSTIGVGNLLTNTHLISIGSRQNAAAGYDLNVNGSINKISVYSRALTPAEISQNCNAQKARFAGATCN